MDKESLKEYLKNIPDEKKVTKEILGRMSCEEFRENLKKHGYIDINIINIINEEL